MNIPLSNVTLTDAAKRYATEAIQSSWISGTGPRIAEFEQALAERHFRRDTVAVANGTVALEIVLRALDIRPGDEVIVPALTFVAPAAAVRSVGAKPVFADVNAETWTIDPDLAKVRINKHTMAIIAVDLLGHPCDYRRLQEIRGDVDLIEDAAEAHGAHYRALPVGNFGMASTFSFHANKTISTGEGGAILSDALNFTKRARLLVNHGMESSRPYWHDVVGTNARMTNVTAAIGLGQAESWDDLVAARNKVAAQYDERLKDIFEKFPLYRRPVAEWATEACWLYTVAHPDRNAIVAQLREKGIDARAIWPALSQLPLYRDSVRGQYPIAEKISREAFWLPTWAGMPEAIIDEICATLRHIIEQTELAYICVPTT